MVNNLKSGNWILVEKETQRAIAVNIIDESPTGYTTSLNRFYIKADWEAVVRCEASLVLQMAPVLEAE